MKPNTCIICLVIFCVVFPFNSADAAVVKSERIEARFSENGYINEIVVDSAFRQDVVSATQLEGCGYAGGMQTRALGGGGIEYVRTLRRFEDNHTFTLTDRFLPDNGSIRWEVDIHDTGASWDTVIQTFVQFPMREEMLFWTAWSDLSRINPPEREKQGTFYTSDSYDWSDPLEPQRMIDAVLYYGAPQYSYDDPKLGFCPFRKDLFCIPLAIVLDVKNDVGLSLVLSPEDTMFDMTMETSAEGGITFRRYFNRIGEGRHITFTTHIVVHEADWRPALGWMVNKYGNYFKPAIPAAHEISGTGAYSFQWVDFDAQK